MFVCYAFHYTFFDNFENEMMRITEIGFIAGCFQGHWISYFIVSTSCTTPRMYAQCTCMYVHINNYYARTCN